MPNLEDNDTSSLLVTMLVILAVALGMALMDGCPRHTLSSERTEVVVR